MLPDQKLLSQSLLELKQLKSNRTPKVLCLNLAKHIKGSKECYLLGQKTNTQIFGVTPSIKLQNDTQTTVKQWKMRCRTKTFVCFSSSYVVFVSSLCHFEHVGQLLTWGSSTCRISMVMKSSTLSTRASIRRLHGCTRGKAEENGRWAQWWPSHRFREPEPRTAYAKSFWFHLLRHHQIFRVSRGRCDHADVRGQASQLGFGILTSHQQPCRVTSGRTRVNTIWLTSPIKEIYQG